MRIFPPAGSRKRKKCLEERDFAGLNFKQRIKVRMRKCNPLSWKTGCGVLAGLLLLLFVCPLLPSGFFVQAVDTDADSAGANDIQMDFVGDMMLGRYIMEYGEQYGYDSLFENITDYWEDADLVFANLDSAVLLEDEDTYEQPDKSVYFYTTYTGLEAALTAGVNVFSCANNHSFDYGEKAVEELCSYFQEEEIIYSGIGETREEAALYQLIEMNGYTIAYLAITDVYSDASVVTPEQAGVLTTAYSGYNQIIYEASQEADLTIVYVYWGDENAVATDSSQESFGHQLIDAGADIVIGSHPHVVQEVELYRDGIIFYSLGNFIFDQGNSWSKDSLMVEYTLGEDGTGEFVLYPLRLNDGVPAVTSNPFYKLRINRELSQGLEDDQYYINDEGYIVIPFDI